MSRNCSKRSLVYSSRESTIHLWWRGGSDVTDWHAADKHTCTLALERRGQDIYQHSTSNLGKLLSNKHTGCIRTYHPTKIEHQRERDTGQEVLWSTHQLFTIFNALIELFVTNRCWCFAFQIGLDRFVLHVEVTEILLKKGSECRLKWLCNRFLPTGTRSFTTYMCGSGWIFKALLDSSILLQTEINVRSSLDY